MRTVVGLYDRLEDAQAVVQALKDAGFRGQDISLVARDREGKFSRQTDTKTDTVADGAVAGAGIGAALGGIGGFLVGLGLLTIPGIGPVLAAGPLAAALAGAGIGAAAGGIVGALIDLGIPEEQANRYAEGIRRGGTLVVVRADDPMADQAVQIMNRFHPVDINRRSQNWTEKDKWSQFDTHAQPLTTDHFDRIDEKGGETTIPVVEEDVQVGKRDVESGGVHVHAFVEETPVEKNVNLRQEHIEVERRPVDRAVSPSDAQFVEGEYDLTEHHEEPMVRKEARVVEEVNIRKDVDQQDQTVRETARRQRVEVDDRTTDMETDLSPRYQEHYRTTYGSSGHDFDYYRGAYDYGDQLARDQRYQDMQWRQVEPAARQWWETNYRQTPWNDVRDAIYYGWEEAGRE